MTLTLKSLSQQLGNGEFSSVELTQHYLNRANNSSLNTYISLCEETALQQARLADQEIAKGKTVENPLLGIPLAHKDIFCIKGTRTTCGSKMLANFVSPYTATVINKLENLGSVTLGKANMDEFAMGSSTENSYFGATINPWSQGDNKLTPGGSSGGSAAAVAAQLAPAASGTDTGGSIRQPAAFCGLTGVKPSYGRCSRYGMVAFASSLDQAGPLTRTAEDAALMLNAMCGYDERDSTSLNIPDEDFTRLLAESIKDIKIGIPNEFFQNGLDNEIAQHVQTALAEYEQLGAKLIPLSLPNSKMALSSYYVIAPAEASSNLSRFDGVRYGHRTENYENLAELYQRSRAEGFGNEVKRRIMIGTYALSSGYYDAYYTKAQKIRRLIANDFHHAFTQCDVIAGPTTPSVAFPLNEKKTDPVAMYLNDIYTIPVNLAGLPACSIPCGLSQSGLPIGLQLIAPYLQEAPMLNIAHQYQQHSDWHLQTAPSVKATL